ncbi:zinc finger protein 77-like [Drosophila nasuta]|uniref:zinc finger protein 77-like n=1 Tax=Drosophila nasuta TaxID=42062 RepID=UPI00295E2D4F|nr:zinc finger protein 77-like [Drosophila nasuta]
MDETSGNVVVSASQQQQATTGNAGGEVLPHCRLNQHLRSHDDEKLYMCEVCGKMLKHLRNYKEHIMKHTNVQQHQCNICERFYHTTSSLAAHMRTHTEDKPYNLSVKNKKGRELKEQRAKHF